VLDLGAGTGALTRGLARTGARVVAVELDPGLARRLRGDFLVVEDEILRVPLPAEPFRVVANLPFACTTAALRRVLDRRVHLQSADVIVQWEVAAKRAAVWPSTRLGVEWGAWHELSIGRRIPRCCFAPPPSVDCAVLRITRREVPRLPVEHASDYLRFVERGFRGGLRAVASTLQLKRAATELGFARDAAPGDLGPDQWSALYRVVRRR
jgi:23S rRNA (adenine-N6)-dimethyltransferase